MPDNILAFLIDIFHLFLMFFPLLIYFVDIPKWIIILSFITFSSVPFLWFILKDKCFLSIVVNHLTKNEKSFSEKYLMWLYNPLKIFLTEPNSKNITEVGAWIHWFVNMFLLWFFIFFYKRKKFC